MIVSPLRCILDALTRLYACGWGGVVEKEDLTVLGVTRTVYWIEEESKIVGDYSPFGTILLNRTVAEEFPDGVIEYGFLHEVGHDQLNGAIRTLLLILMIGFGFLALGTLITLPILAFQLPILTASIYQVPLFIGFIITFGILGCLPFILTSWLLELHAELHAISKLGVNEFRSVRATMREASDRGKLKKTWYYARYPPDGLIIKIARWRDVG